jgi:hypothetical protein
MRSRAIAIFCALLVVAGVGDRFAPRSTFAAPDPAGVSDAPRNNAAGSTWYCAAGTANAGAGDSEVIIANPTPRAISGRATVVPSQGASQQRAISVGPSSRGVLHPRDVVSAPYAAVLVELDQGGATVEHDVSGALGFDIAACAATASPQWYLAQGATTKNTALVVALFNPFSDDAIVDLKFSTEQGRAEPADLQGIVVPPRGLVVQNIGDHVRRRESIATSVVARSGRIVVEQLEIRNDPGQRGITLELAAPRLAPEWWFPEGVVRDGTVERFHLYNPTTREARVDIELTLDVGVIDPIGVSVPPESSVTVVANDEASIPKGVGHSATVRSLDDIGIVAERSIDVTGPRSGRTAEVGAVAAARTWVLGAGVATEGVEEWVVVQNVSGSPAQLSVTLLEDGERRLLDRLGGLQLAAGARRGYRINDAATRANGALLVASTEPVVVERALYRIGRTGISAALGVPLRD